MSAATTPAKPLQNVYYERKVATERPCYICKRGTSTVLATIDTKDFVYTCESHLSDRGFATLLNPPAATPAPSGPSQEDIKKVIADYKAREAKKEEKKAEAEDAREPPLTTSASASPKPTSPPPAASPPPAPSHRKYALHRQIFDMRVAEIKRKEQGVKAREVGKGLPQVPRGMF